MTSARVLEVCLRFGVPAEGSGRPGGILNRLGLEPQRGELTVVVGPSGAGKSTLLGELARRYPASRLVHQVQFPLDVAVIDAVAPTRAISEAAGLLTACGLGEPALWLRRFDQLSEGERFRARLARAIGMQRRDGGDAPLLCDEFAVGLHDRLARAVSHNLRKLVSRERLPLILATSREELLGDLRPDRLIRLPEARVETRPFETQATRLRMLSRCRIERGGVRDYTAFAEMHYRRREELGFVDQVFVLREGRGGELLGVVVYGHPALELALRNRVTHGRFVRRPDRLNRELRVLKRLVIHPDLRGCGVGHWFVRRTLPMVGTRFVECLAAMGLVNPVFEKAGMMRVGVCSLPARWEGVLAELRALGVDALGADFATEIARRPAVREVVARAVYDWYRATTGGGVARVARQTASTLAGTFRQLAGSAPVYYVWARDAAGRQFLQEGMCRVDEGQPAERSLRLVGGDERGAVAALVEPVCAAESRRAVTEQPTFGVAGDGDRAPSPASLLPKN